jgi:hypothetical protein
LCSAFFEKYSQTSRPMEAGTKILVSEGMWCKPGTPLEKSISAGMLSSSIGSSLIDLFILTDFSLCRFTTRDNPDLSHYRTYRSPYISHGQHRTIRGSYDREPTLFGFTVLQISDCEQVRVVENSACKIERNAVLTYVRRRLTSFHSKCNWRSCKPHCRASRNVRGVGRTPNMVPLFNGGAIASSWQRLTGYDKGGAVQSSRKTL